MFYLPIAFSAVGVLLPDIVDKIFYTLGVLPCGRSLGHNLFFGPILALITYVVTRRKNYALAIWFGAYLHLLQDITGFIPWLYPLVNYQFGCGPIQIVIDPLDLVAEPLGVILLFISIAFNSKVLHYREKFWSWVNHGSRKSKKKVRRKKR